MKKLLIIFNLLAFATSALAINQVVKPYTFVEGTRAKASEVNANFDTVYSGTNAAISAINTAAGSKTSLDSRLDVSMNEDGTLKGYVHASAFANLSTAKVSIGSAVRTLYVGTGVTATCNTLTLPSNIRLEVAPGGIVDASGVLTLAAQPILGNYQTFTNTSAVEGLMAAKTIWWGRTGTNDHLAVQRAINSVRASGGTVTAEPGATYNTAARINVYDNIIYDGAGSSYNMVADAGQYSVFGIVPYGANTSVSNATLKNVKMSWATNNEATAPTDPILVDRGNHVLIDNVEVINAKDNAIELWECSDTIIRRSRLVTPANHGVTSLYSPPNDKRCSSFTVEDNYIEPGKLAVDAQLKDAQSVAIIKNNNIVNAGGVVKNQGSGHVIFEGNSVHMRDSQTEIAFNLATPGWTIKNNRVLNCHRPFAFTNNIEDAARQLGNVVIEGNYFGPSNTASLLYLFWFRNNADIKNVLIKGNIFDVNESRANSDARKYIFAQPVSGTVKIDNFKMDANIFFMEAFSTGILFDLNTNIATTSYFDINNNIIDLTTTNSNASSGYSAAVNSNVKWMNNILKLPATATNFQHWSKGANAVIQDGQTLIESSISNAPVSIGQIAIVDGVIYISRGTSSAADWVKVSN